MQESAIIKVNFHCDLRVNQFYKYWFASSSKILLDYKNIHLDHDVTAPEWRQSTLWDARK